MTSQFVTAAADEFTDGDAVMLTQVLTDVTATTQHQHYQSMAHF